MSPKPEAPDSQPIETKNPIDVAYEIIKGAVHKKHNELKSTNTPWSNDIVTGVLDQLKELGALQPNIDAVPQFIQPTNNIFIVITDTTTRKYGQFSIRLSQLSSE